MEAYIHNTDFLKSTYAYTLVTDASWEWLQQFTYR